MAIHTASPNTQLAHVISYGNTKNNAISRPARCDKRGARCAQHMCRRLSLTQFTFVLPSNISTTTGDGAFTHNLWRTWTFLKQCAAAVALMYVVRSSIRFIAHSGREYLSRMNVDVPFSVVTYMRNAISSKQSLHETVFGSILYMRIWELFHFGFFVMPYVNSDN